MTQTEARLTQLLALWKLLCIIRVCFKEGDPPLHGPADGSDYKCLGLIQLPQVSVLKIVWWRGWADVAVPALLCGGWDHTSMAACPTTYPHTQPNPLRSYTHAIQTFLNISSHRYNINSGPVKTGWSNFSKRIHSYKESCFSVMPFFSYKWFQEKHLTLTFLTHKKKVLAKKGSSYYIRVRKRSERFFVEPKMSSLWRTF